MGQEIIRDVLGRTLGTIVDMGGTRIAYDYMGRVVGIYDSLANHTRDALGRVICSGDALVGLLAKQ